MKKVILLLISLFSISAFANTPALCRSYGGTGETLRTAEAQYKYIDLCKFGTSGIEALTLDNYARYHNGVQIVRKYIDNEVYWPKDCIPSGGWIVTALDANNQRVNLCQFYDGSMMEARTFGLGVDAPENMRMNQVLGIH